MYGIVEISRERAFYYSAAKTSVAVVKYDELTGSNRALGRIEYYFGSIGGIICYVHRTILIGLSVSRFSRTTKLGGLRRIADKIERRSAKRSRIKHGIFSA